jgi:hypothetical protein
LLGDDAGQGNWDVIAPAAGASAKVKAAGRKAKAWQFLA